MPSKQTKAIIKLWNIFISEFLYAGQSWIKFLPLGCLVDLGVNEIPHKNKICSTLYPSGEKEGQQLITTCIIIEVTIKVNRDHYMAQS